MSAIVGYTYQTETLCSSCVCTAVSPGAGVDMPTEKWLDRMATQMSVNRQDEYSFDSEDFPKVIFSWQVDTVETCDQCGREL